MKRGPYKVKTPAWMKVTCPACFSEPGNLCVSYTALRQQLAEPHPVRRRMAKRKRVA
jgi:hypothetical protein